MKHNLKLFAVFFVMQFLLVSFAFAQDNPNPRKKMPGMKAGMKMRESMSCPYDADKGAFDVEQKFFEKIDMIMSYGDDIGLSDAQRQKVLDQEYDLKKSLIRTGADIDTLDLDMKREFMKDEMNVKTIAALVDKKYEMKAQRIKDIVSAYDQINKTLTAEQNSQLKKIWLEQMPGQESMGQYRKPMMMRKEQGAMMPMGEGRQGMMSEEE